MSLSKLKARVEQLAESVKESFADEATQKFRIEICNSCEHLFSPTRNCKKCGCFVDAKTRIKSSSCPIAKWPAVK